MVLIVVLCPGNAAHNGVDCGVDRCVDHWDESYNSDAGTVLLSNSHVGSFFQVFWLSLDTITFLLLVSKCWRLYSAFLSKIFFVFGNRHRALFVCFSIQPRTKYSRQNGAGSAVILEVMYYPPPPPFAMLICRICIYFLRKYSCVFNVLFLCGSV